MKYTVEEYREALQRHDWFYDCSEDPRVYRKGADQRSKINAMQYHLDRDHKIWNEYAPEIYHRSNDKVKADG